MSERDVAREGSRGGAMPEGAAAWMRAAFMIPIETMKAACDMQRKMLEAFEQWLVPGKAGADKSAPGGGPGTPAPGAGAAASSPPGAAKGAGGWGPVTPQVQVTGWGPMPPVPR